MKAEVSYKTKLDSSWFGAREMTVGLVGNNLLNENIRNSVSYNKDEVLLPGIGVRAFANEVRGRVVGATSLQSGRIAPDTSANAPSTSSATSRRLIVHRSRHGGPPLRNRLESDAAVIRLVADQQHEPVTSCFRVFQRAIKQRAADPTAPERRLDRQRPQQQRLGIADANRQLPHRTDQQRADPRRKRQIEQMIDMLAQPVSAQHETAGPECPLMQPLDRLRVIGGFGRYGK